MYPKLRIAIIAFLTVFALRAAAQTIRGNGAKNEPKRSSSSPELKQGTIETRVEKYLRNLYAWGPSYEVKVGPTKPPNIPALLEVPVTVSMTGQEDTAIVYVTKSGSFILRGMLADTSIDPFADIRSKLHPGNSPSKGPENAQ